MRGIHSGGVMASAFAHAAAASALGAAAGIPFQAQRIWLLGIACSILPDVDSVGFFLGIPYEHVLGHRGLTHSLPFATVLAWTVVRGLFPDTSGALRYRLYLYFFLCTASHGLLDAMTDGGMGIAFFAPFHNARYFAPFRPIVVSPLEPEQFFTRQALSILRSEFLWVVLPSLGLAVLAQMWRSATGRDRSGQRR